MDSTYNNKYNINKEKERDSLYKTQIELTTRKRAHTIYTCAVMKYSGIHKYSHIITMFIIITFPPPLLSFEVGVQNDQEVKVHEWNDKQELDKLVQVVVSQLKLQGDLDFV